MILQNKTIGESLSKNLETKTKFLVDEMINKNGGLISELTSDIVVQIINEELDKIIAKTLN